MSNQWGSGQVQQGLPGNSSQVKMFDPTHFQMHAPFGQTDPSRSVPEPKQQNSDIHHHHVPAAQTPHSSWDSWGSWSFNGNNQGSNSSQQQEVEPGHVQTQKSSDEKNMDNGYHGGMWYGWDNSSNQNSPHNYSQLNTSVDYNQTPQHDYQSYSGVTSAENTLDHSLHVLQSPQNDIYFGTYYNPHQSGEHAQNYNQDNSQTFGHGNVQNYNQDNSQTFSHGQSYYDQQHDDSIWARGNNPQEYPFPETAGSVQQSNNLENVSESLSSAITDASSIGDNTMGQAGDNSLSVAASVNCPSGSIVSNPTVSEIPCISVAPREVVPGYDNDDDGTVSGYFGRDGDGDGDVLLNTQRHIHETGGSKDKNPSAGNPQFLTVNPQFHRTNSEISNASLSTLNLSYSEDDDGQEPLHNIQRLVKKMEEIDLAQQHGKINNNMDDNERDQVNITSDCDAGMPGLYVNSESKQRRGDYSGFGSDNQNIVQSSVPFEKNTPFRGDRDNPSSAESGGSSGLADWEFVSPMAHLTQNQNHFQDNNVGDKSGHFVDRENLSPEDGSSQNHFSDSHSKHNNQIVYQNLNSAGPVSHSNTSLPSESNNLSHETRGRSGSPFVAALTDHRQEELIPQRTHPPSQTSANSSPKANLSETSATSQSDGATLTSKRGTGRSQTNLHSSHHTSVSSSSSSLPDSRQNKISDALTASPLVNPPSASPISSDGSCISNRESGKAVRTAETTTTHNRQLEEPPIQSSSRRNSGEMSSPERKHQSAFHAVSRQRQLAMSPATTLWNNTEAPASNILLAPAMPLIIPNLNTSQVSVDNSLLPGKVDNVIDRSRSKDQSGSSRSLVPERRDNETKATEYRSKEVTRRDDKSRSYDSLDEVDAVPDDRSFDSQRSDLPDTSYSQDSYRRDVPRRYVQRQTYRGDISSSRNDRDRPASRSDRDRPASRSDRDRPISRSDRPTSRSDQSGHYHYERLANRPDDYNRHYAYGRDYTDSSYDERYDRPRSRQEEHQGSRPSSRSVQEGDRPRSRSNYEHERDYYYKDAHRGYRYDNYGRHADYYNERERYYRYYKEKEARYARGYYDEYYAANQDYYGNRTSRPDSRNDYSRDYYSRGYAYEGYNTYYDGYGYDPYAYGYQYPSYDEYIQGYKDGRLTPPKYSYPHTRACFGPAGQLVKVLPNQPTSGQPAVIELQDVQELLESCQEADKLRGFPGPLTRTHTHKKDVLIFCQQKAKSCRDDVNMVDRESAQLIWKFLELLIKQNGSVVGTDLADLLLEGHEPSTHEYSTHGVRISQSPEPLELVREGNSESSSSVCASPAAGRVAMDRTVIANTADWEREKWIDRFRNLLLYGHKKDALECAMKNNLWGHALFLASKMDARTHANVMTRFANGAIRMNDPLQTLYQLMSGRQPAAVTCMVDERWGDWRPHLAMILSNQTSRQDIDRKSITTLGDTLAAKGYLYASHFCYLMAQTNFGSYIKKTSKIVLIGSNHNLSLYEFATNEAVQCTEVYEYAQSLGNPAFCLPYFQAFKYLYACRLADYGMPLEALQYCEVIASHIYQYPSWFHSTFVKLVYQLASKLKYCDPQRQIASDDTEDCLWLQHLEKICVSYDDGSVHPLSGTATPAGYPGMTTSSESGDTSSYGYGYRPDATTPSTMSSVPVGTYGHQHNMADNTDYSDGQDVGLAPVDGQNVIGTDQHIDYSQQQYNYNQWQQVYGYQYPSQEQHPEQLQQLQQHTIDHTDHPHQLTQPQTTYHHNYPPAPTPHDDAPSNVDGGRHTTDSIPQTDHTLYHGGSQMDSSSMPIHPASSVASTQPAAQMHTQDYRNFDVSEQIEHQSVRPDVEGSVLVTDSRSNSFNYFDNVESHKVIPPASRYRHMSGSSVASNSRRRTVSSSSTGSTQAAPLKQPQTQHHSSGSKNLDKQVMKDGPPNNGGGRWPLGPLGKIINKFTMKGKNEMILPDDKNPSIVWDPVKKKWTNADGTEEEEMASAPPPKDTDLFSKQSSLTSGPPPPSSMAPGSNRFSLKAKGSRNQYVDVNNPKTILLPQSLLPETTLGTNVGLNFFMPDQTGTEVTQPNIDNGALTMASSLNKSTNNSADIVVPSQTASTLPMMFNPSTIRNSPAGIGQGQPTSAGPGLKVGQRRAYPK